MSLQRLLLIATLILAAAPARAGEDEEEAGRAVQDDPYARVIERRQRFGERTAEDAARILSIAHAEAQRVGLNRPGALRNRMAAGQAVQGSAWINIGPTGASYEKNDVTFTKVDSGRINKILVHPVDANIVYVATSGGGAWKTFNASTPVTATSGPRWFPITESLGALAVGSMAMDPQNSETLVLGLGDPFDVQVPGLVYSTDGGATWSTPLKLKGTYPGNGDVLASSVRDIQFDQGSSGEVLAATDAGLFRSQQGGVGNDWTLVDLAMDHTPQDCWSVAWVGPRTWMAACYGSLWRSTDGGAHWDDALGKLAGGSRARRMTVVAAPGTRGTLDARVYVLASANDIPNPLKPGHTKWGTLDLFRSDDGGVTFAGLGLNSSGRPSNPNLDQLDLDVLHNQAWYNQMLAVDPFHPDSVMVGGNLSMVRSLDGGHHWDVMSDWLPWVSVNPQAHGLTYVHADFHAGTISYSGPDHRFLFYAGTDGGVFRSGDVLSAAAGAATFEDGMNRGIVTHLAYSVGADETDSNNTLVIGGLQDNGTRMRAKVTDASGPTFFNQVWGGDGIGVGVGKFNGGAVGTLLVVSNPSSLERSQDGGQSFAPMMAGLPMNALGQLPDGNFFMKVATDFGDPQVKTFLTMANLGDGAHIYKWVDNGSPLDSWHEITGTVTRRAGGTASTFVDGLNNLAADPMHPGQYGAVSYYRAYVKAPAATAWTESATAPQASLSSIAFDPATAGTFWVSSASSSAGGHVFFTTDGGATWQDGNGGGAAALPDVPVNVVKVDPNDSKTIYAGTELGLYRSSDAGRTWARYGTGLPLVSVTDLSVALDSSAIRVATYGRGFWELHPSYGVPSGVHGTGDFDGNQQIDGFDLIGLAGVMGLTSADTGYTATGNLVGATNSIDNDDARALIAKMGSRP